MYCNILRFGCVLGFALLFEVQASSDFAGSKSCKTCHLKIYESYQQTGHPHKLHKVTDESPAFPADTSAGIPNPPAGHQWKDISYIIGGYGWKARFMNEQGYILTGEERQYNLANPLLDIDAHWVAYGGKKSSQKPYTCGGCHATGWVSTGINGSHQDGLPGIYGTWTEAGVTCEACHGPSAAHVKAPSKVKPSTEENCGSCHSRGEVTAIDASSGLIKHHEQYEDLLASPHKALACGSCHKPHQSSRYQLGGYKGDDNTCKTCHQGIQIKLKEKQNQSCNSCHMPFAVTSAVSTSIPYKGGSVAKGDLRTHIHRISMVSTWKMFTDDGKFVRVDSDNKAYLTLDYACLSCHTDQDMDWAMTNAKRIH